MGDGGALGDFGWFLEPFHCRAALMQGIGLNPGLFRVKTNLEIN